MWLTFSLEEQEGAKAPSKFWEGVMKIFKFSEFWMALFALAGTVLDKLGIVNPDAWNAIIVPTLIYIVGRFISGVANKKYTAPSALYDARTGLPLRKQPEV